MSESRNCFQSISHGGGKDSVCIDCNRILDSCRDKDCFDDTKVYLTGFGQEIIEKTSAVRVKSTKICGTAINVEALKFNRGFYKVNVRFYVKLDIEACMCAGRSQDIDGIAVCEKNVILYGSEGNVNIFRSGGCDDSFCSPIHSCEASNNMPVAVVEAVDPIALGVKIADKLKSCRCCCSASEIPDNVCCCINGPVSDSGDCEKQLLVTLGFFSVVRLERPGQYMIQATAYAVPEKECVPDDDGDPCALFSKMSFPLGEFYPPSFKQLNGKDAANPSCGCSDK